MVSRTDRTENRRNSPARGRRGEQSSVDARTALARTCHGGGMTLVVGAGISMGRGLPNWNTLARGLWRAAFGRRPSPWDMDKDGESLRAIPQFLPIVFELVRQELGADNFLKVLRAQLYRDARYPIKDAAFRNSSESLAVLARLLVQEFERGRERRIDAVITLNADDMLEQAAFALRGGASFRRGEEVVRVVARPTHSPLRGQKWQPIRIYHIHGFLPANDPSNYGGNSGMRFTNAFNHMLVFTDTQYWSTSATALAFANRVMLTALSESSCVFVGLSMTDINLLRWLALRTLDRDRDASETEHLGKPSLQTKILDNMFYRHFWVRPGSDDPTGLLSEFLLARGIHSVPIETWKDEGFQTLVGECFPV